MTQVRFLGLQRWGRAHFDNMALIFFVILAIAVFCLAVGAVQALLLLYYSVWRLGGVWEAESPTAAR